ncbi:UPF0187-domain-containing protein [Lepidopterella palustris CBS 459.81]|uniref:UPF0187-domain-containing protein n=1 Tax=Lepidopterella palustris CBS 459.81 TaxID=1314670 RepID=A0A8E2EA68_9PEZI|nr:UPF0187-domain-containing protein [Lepidopterella palustris CBS 459.81]
MRSQHHHHPFRSLRGWHASQREQRKQTRWVPYSLRWKGGVVLKIIPNILISGLLATAICCISAFWSDNLSLHAPVLFPAFAFVVGLAVSFRMSATYSRWWEGRTEWDKLSALSRSFSRTIWLHVPLSTSPAQRIKQIQEKKSVIQAVRTLAVALKHHLRGERDWDECIELRELLRGLPDYPYSATNHPLTITLYLSRYIEHTRTTTPIDTQVLTHLLTHVDGFTSVISACERLLRTPLPLGYNIAISRIVWIFVLGLPSQLWREMRWWSIGVTMVVSYAIFALAEVGLEIENPWGEGPNDLDLDRYCNLLALDLEETMTFPEKEVLLIEEEL